MDETDKQEVRRLEQEHQAFRDGIFRATQAWGALENNLAWLLRAMIGRTKDRHLAYAIYFAPGNTETRIAIVNAAYKHCPLDDISGPILDACFKKTIQKINKAKDSRNKIAHGNLVTIDTGRANHIRWTGAFWDVHRGPIADRGNGQLSGMSAEDIRQITKKINDCCHLVMLLAGLWDDHRKRVPVATLQKRLLELAVRLKVAAPQQTTQIPPAL